MTGPEHYAEAERLLAERDAVHPVDTFGAGSRRHGDHERDDMLASAQVHATLAQAAATLDARLNKHLLADWAEVLS
jgi:hypothetical protein